ncbi:MAG: response regulator transcription factor [Desulfopila sp.]
MPSTPTNRVLLIDDDEELGQILRRYLESFHFQVSVAEIPSCGLQLLKENNYEVILLDVMLPEKDGFELCREIVAAPGLYGAVPIIMLTARGDAIDRIIGLEIGAEDYLAKPFEPRELLARIRNVIRRRSRREQPIAPEGLAIDFKTRQVWLDSALIELTGLEWELLALLAREPGRLFGRDEIMDTLHGIDADIFSRAIDALVSRLRSKLGDTAKTPRFIKTVWGRGYLFIDTTSMAGPESLSHNET